jgi:hypothetical protein
MLTDFLTAILAAILLGGGAWYLFAFVRYMRSGQYDVDKRFRELSR